MENAQYVLKAISKRRIVSEPVDEEPKKMETEFKSDKKIICNTVKHTIEKEVAEPSSDSLPGKTKQLQKEPKGH